MHDAKAHHLRSALHAIERQLDLLSWHIKELRPDASGCVREEIDGGMEKVRDALGAVGVEDKGE